MKFQPALIPRFNNDYNLNDLIYAIKSIFFKNYNNIDILYKLFTTKNFFFTNNGRSSLYIILKSLNLPKKSMVGVPLYSCPVVFDAIIKAGYTPCFIDVELHNYTLDLSDLKNKIYKISALVVIHTFGRPAEMDEIKKIAANIPIIEDCAHSFLSEYNGKKTGTLGTASFFSLAKYISVGGGSLIILNDMDFIENTTYEISLLKTSSKFEEIKHSLFTYIFYFLYHKPWFGSFAFQIGNYIDKKVDISGKKGFESTKIKTSDFNVFIRKLEFIEEKINLQRKNSQILINKLKNCGFELPYEKAGTKCNFFLFPLLFSNREKRDYVCDFLRENDIDSMKLYSMTPEIARKMYGYQNDCPNTEELTGRILVIPNQYSLNLKELLKIADTIKKCRGVS